ncbi:hypothetical protein O988_07827 [Pseudogymnoascus sp. VKM F-3808]|nr:hypothetical protein O988_07827 [Pseudogymnoascus sp. VKM F-3808]KFX91983.1 hypothetical protein V490_05628 [Pseudogymnoascus sp. VKM F-3557]
MKLTAAALAALAPQACLCLVQSDWSFPNSPSGGLKDLTFGFYMGYAPHAAGYYFAQQFNFNGISDVGYIGLQPRPNVDGHNVAHAAFSTFQAGSTTSDPNCSQGADGGAGVSCAVDFNADYSHTYHVVVEFDSGTTWSGKVVDTTSGQETHIGTYTLPSGAGGIKSSQVGFVEYYPWNSGTHNCGDLPKAGVTMYYPTTSTSGAGTGTIGQPYENGDCVGDVAFSISQGVGAWNINVGF